MVGLARSTPYDGSSSSPSRSPVRAAAGTYLLKGYSVFNERDIDVFCRSYDQVQMKTQDSGIIPHPESLVKRFQEIFLYFFFTIIY